MKTNKDGWKSCNSRGDYKIPITKGWITFLLTTILAGFGGYFITLPAINLHSVGFWAWVAITLGIATLISSIVDSVVCEKMGKDVPASKVEIPMYSATIVGVGAVIGILLLILLGSLVSARMFRAKVYANRIQVEESTFSDIIPEVNDIGNIALMDTETARIIGKRAMGSLTEMVSQYQVSENYSTIDFCKTPKKVAPLEYTGFIKYLNNKSSGIPGYILVDPVKNTAEYIACKEPIRYSPSAFFHYDLLRHIRSVYKTEVFEGHYFEIDDEGVPYWICPVLSYSTFLGASMIDSVVIVNASSGAMEKYPINSIPQWVDRVYDGDLLLKAFDDYGELRHGFWNYLFSKKDCKTTTDDYGYKVIDGDVWVYTGVTSVANDESNIGFVLMNQRTARCIYFPVAGAEEYSAMGAAEGALQDLRYTASFPSLVNIDSVPTYVCVMKDNGGLIKMYAMIHVEQYNIVATGVTANETLKKYRQMLADRTLNDISDDIEVKEKEIIIKKLHFIVIEGDTFVYIQSEEGEVFKQRFADNESLILLQEGEPLKISYVEDENAIYDVIAIEG